MVDATPPLKAEVRKLRVFYGENEAIKGVDMPIHVNRITALIGPSGCGKTTLLRCFNRMHDFQKNVRYEGEIVLFPNEQNLLSRDVDPMEVRLLTGMVFQKPNPFPKSIFDNVAYGPRVIQKNLSKSQTQDIVEQSLQRAGLWDEVKTDLNKNGFALSGGQQQRLCIARAIATNPDVLLMDEPCASLDPIATSIIESLMMDLVKDYTVVIVTHNMQQAARVSDRTAFFTAEIDGNGERYGYLVEIDDTEKMFINPSNKRTEDYIAGRFG